MLRSSVIAAVLLALASSTGAPLQCASSRRPASLAREDSPAEALWLLAERFGQQGNAAARADTLRFLADRYPSSRFAVRARDELGAGRGERP